MCSVLRPCQLLSSQIVLHVYVAQERLNALPAPYYQQANDHFEAIESIGANASVSAVTLTTGCFLDSGPTACRRCYEHSSVESCS